MKSHNKYEPLLVLLLSTAIYLIFFVLSAKEAVDAKTIVDVLLDFSLIFFITLLIWYGLNAIERLLDKKISWEKYGYKYILLQVVVITIYTAVVIYSLSQFYHVVVCESRGSESPVPEELSIVLGVLIAFLVTSIHTGGDLFKKWKESLVDVEKYRKESVEAKYETLKNQVNPHFLFNSFSVLSSLISLDSERAESFVDKLSKVYRYTLDNNDKELIALEEELTFIKSYIFLLETRFGSNLQVNINVKDEFMKQLILPMSLQILVENAVKHNVISKNRNLVVDIFVVNNCLVVSNNLQLRTVEEDSTKIGLKNIENRYKYFTNEGVIIESDIKFTVKLPLLKIDS